MSVNGPFLLHLSPPFNDGDNGYGDEYALELGVCRKKISRLRIRKRRERWGGCGLLAAATG